MRFLPLFLSLVLAVASAVLTALDSPWWLVCVAVFGFLSLVGIYDLVQTRHSIL